MQDCLISFGSNLGNSREFLLQVCQRLIEQIGAVNLRASEPVSTPPVGGPEGQSEYLNACIRFDSELQASELMRSLIAIEKELGRQRKQRWGSRTVDLDLLLYGDQIIFDQVKIPHPRMSFRRFVLVPANSIAGEMVHPLSGLTIAELLKHIQVSEERLGVVTSSDAPMLDAVSDIRRVCKVDDFSLSHFVRITDGNPTMMEMKILAFFENDHPGIVELAKKFRGPTLCLNRLDEQYMTSEILAAIAATKPF